MEEEEAAAAAAEGRRSSLEVCFGDHQSTLLDEFERLAFEAHLERTILRRSYSEPSPVRFMDWANPVPQTALPQPQSREGKPSKLVRALQRLFEAFVSVVFGKGREETGPSRPDGPVWKALSKSSRM